MKRTANSRKGFCETKNYYLLTIFEFWYGCGCVFDVFENEFVIVC